MFALYDTKNNGAAKKAKAGFLNAYFILMNSDLLWHDDVIPGLALRYDWTGRRRRCVRRCDRQGRCHGERVSGKAAEWT